MPRTILARAAQALILRTGPQRRANFHVSMRIADRSFRIPVLAARA